MRRWLVPLSIAAVVLVLGVAAVFVVSRSSDRERFEDEHGVPLPASATALQVMGDASNPILRWVELDRGASSIFVIPRSDLDDFLDRFDWEEQEGPFGWSQIPGNAQYQPDTVPWAAPAEPDEVYSTESPPSSADYATVEVYRLSDDRVGVWIYSDWN